MNEEISTERELWNTAKIYSVTHVAEPLVRCRKFITICLFGVEEIGEEYNYPESVLNQNKIFAIQRLCEELKQLIEDNVNFVKKEQKKGLGDLLKKIEDVSSFIDGVSSFKYDQRTKSSVITLNVEHFNNCLNVLRKVNSEIKNYLADLIFPAGEKIDFDDLKQRIIEGG